MSSVLKEYPITTSQEILWGDMDAFNHVNNKIYFRYFEDVRVTYFEELGVFNYKTEHEIGPILANTTCQYKLPLQYPDRVTIGARAKILSPKKFEMEHFVYSADQDAIVAVGHCLVIYYDYTKNKSCEIPPLIVSRMNAIEGRTD